MSHSNNNLTSSKAPNSKVEGASQKAALFWMLFPVALLVISVTGWLVMVKVAVDDPGFSVEQDYYKKAANYDDEIARRQQNAALGLQSKVVSFDFIEGQQAKLVVQLLDREGLAVSDYSLKAQAFPVARGNAVQHLEFSAQGEGLYESVAARPRPGLWEVRLTASKDGKSYTQILRAELFAGAAVEGAAAGDPS